MRFRCQRNLKEQFHSHYVCGVRCVIDEGSAAMPVPLFKHLRFKFDWDPQKNHSQLNLLGNLVTASS